MTKRQLGGRTMTIVHKGTRALVKEDHTGRCVIKVGDHLLETDKAFPQAARQALTYLIKNAGAMRGTRDGSYER